MINPKRIFNISNEHEFEKLALEIFHFQVSNIPVYQCFCEGLNIKPSIINRWQDIPFLPISFFKSHEIISPNKKPELVFESSGTTGFTVSRHPIADLEVYEQSILKGFNRHLGNLANFKILALLPGYLERQNSSLVYMVNRLMHVSSHSDNGFYLNDFELLHQALLKSEENNTPTLLIGVSFALLDFADAYKPKLRNTVVMETGGMKGRRKEIVREELHLKLREAFGNDCRISSEYGMTELLSQAYWFEGRFISPPWMRVRIREPEDPLKMSDFGRQGAVNIVDLANIYSCSFLATDDIGKASNYHEFEILGRLDVSDVRGCNLLVS